MCAYFLSLPTGHQEAVFEDVPVGTTILRVTATDADSGNFAVIEYGLGNGEGKFAINPTTVSGQWRAWVWGVESGEGPEHQRLGSHQKDCSHSPISGSCHLHMWCLRGF